MSNDFDIVRKALDLTGQCDGVGSIGHEHEWCAHAALDRILVEYKALVLARKEHAEAAARYGVENERLRKALKAARADLGAASYNIRTALEEVMDAALRPWWSLSMGEKMMRLHEIARTALEGEE